MKVVKHIEPIKFSIIMPSLLSAYPGAANNRMEKIKRAVDSVLSQTFQNFELIIISDGCDLTEWVIKKNYDSEKIKLFRVERKGLFDNSARNFGIENAKGEFIIYLDNDDFYGERHLEIFNENLTGFDWVWAKDWGYYNGKWYERIGDIEQYAHCGTSNICHKRNLPVRWGKPGYGHDYYFIQDLLLFDNYKQIPAAQYYVCHINGSYEL